jgi:Ca2+-binding EF-hand superfamily protein
MGCGLSRAVSPLPSPDEALAQLSTSDDAFAAALQPLYTQFRALDIDKDGRLTKEDAVNGKVPPAIFAAIIRAASLIDSDSISFPEYALLKLSPTFSAARDLQRRLRASHWFKEFDIDGSGLLDFQEVRLAVRAARFDISDAELNDRFEAILAASKSRRLVRKRALTLDLFTRLVLEALAEADRKQAEILAMHAPPPPPPVPATAAQSSGDKGARDDDGDEAGGDDEGEDEEEDEEEGEEGVEKRSEGKRRR